MPIEYTNHYAIDHFLPKRNRGFGTLTEVTIATWLFGQSEAHNVFFFSSFLLKAEKYQCNQAFELCLQFASDVL